jgi:hypothetical protein
VEEGIVDVAQYARIKQSLNLFGLDKRAPYLAPAVRGFWFHGIPGTGKSHTARTRWPGAYIKAQNKWWDGYNQHDAVILDDLDSPAMGHLLKIWADRWPCTGECKHGTVNLHHKVFAVTSNKVPEDLWPTDPILAAAVRRRFRFIEMDEVYVPQDQEDEESNWSIHIDDLQALPEQGQGEAR